jgi:hypothetical protein
MHFLAGVLLQASARTVYALRVSRLLLQAMLLRACQHSVAAIFLPYPLLPYLHQCILPVNLPLMVLAQDLNLLAKLINLDMQTGHAAGQGARRCEV